MNNFREIINQYDRILIQMHNMPDADTCSSAIAMEYMINILNPSAKTTIVYHNNMNLSLDLEQMLETNGTRAIKIETSDLDIFYKRHKVDKNKDLLIYVDCQENGGNVYPLHFKNIIAFDHHVDLNGTNYLYKDITPLGSCSILIYRYMLDYKIDLEDTYIREAIYYGLMIDLDDFVKEMDFETNRLRKLLEAQNIDRLYITTLNSVKFPKNKIRDLSSLIDNSIIDERLFFSIVHDSDDNLIGTLADLLLKFKDVDVVVICNERPTTVKFSIRSRIPSIEAISITNLFTNTGGQKIVGGVTIGGCTVDKKTMTVKYEEQLKLAIYNEVQRFIDRERK
ncbi:DHH family phosphoesterase [Clostridium tertium]|uniref:DHH family phosphoesterase n=1 Tax=Clostridium tertium TaxID=1559 RepID=UPI0023B322CC|nr:DHH family phosphoesterase [Clostridium tertium]